MSGREHGPNVRRDAADGDASVAERRRLRCPWVVHAAFFAIVLAGSLEIHSALGAGASIVGTVPMTR